MTMASELGKEGCDNLKEIIIHSENERNALEVSVAQLLERVVLA